MALAGPSRLSANWDLFEGRGERVLTRQGSLGDHHDHGNGKGSQYDNLDRSCSVSELLGYCGGGGLEGEEDWGIGALFMPEEQEQEEGEDEDEDEDEDDTAVDVIMARLTDTLERRVVQVPLAPYVPSSFIHLVV